MSSTDRYSIKSKQDLLQYSYRTIDDILTKRNTESLSQLQRDIEDVLFEGFNWFNTNTSKINIRYNSKSFDFMVDNRNILKNIFSNPKGYLGNTKSHETEYIPWFNKISKLLGPEMISYMLIQYFLHVLSNEFIKTDDTDLSGIPSITGYNEFGKKVINQYFYQKYIKSNQKCTFSEFKDNDNEYKNINHDNFNARVGGCFVYVLIECNLLKFEIAYRYKDKVN